MNQPLVSICMITYNHEKYIAQAIEGVLMQQCNFAYQLVIGNDHSTDQTRAVCEEYAQKYPDKIKLLPDTGKNMGATQNFIRTYNACTGKYVALCEGDDYWTNPLKLQKQVDFLEENPQYLFAAHGYNTVNNKNTITLENTKEPEQQYPNGKEIDENNVFNIKYTKTLTLVIKRRAITDELFQYRQISDTVLKFHLINKGKGYWLANNMGAYRLHENNTFGTLHIEKKLQTSVFTYYSILKQGIGNTDIAKRTLATSLTYYIKFYIHPNNRTPFRWKKILKLSLMHIHYASDKTQAFSFFKNEIFPVLWLKLKMNTRKKLHV